mmetsp:Transcript_4247/g.6823  ORF Transcript_4247/g.6823 Transcript_4247/m.6823 type:complete len:250 (+) Transcript_4247:1362-2111(+)
MHHQRLFHLVNHRRRLQRNHHLFQVVSLQLDPLRNRRPSQAANHLLNRSEPLLVFLVRNQLPSHRQAHLANQPLNPVISRLVHPRRCLVHNHLRGRHRSQPVRHPQHRPASRRVNQHLYHHANRHVNQQAQLHSLLLNPLLFQQVSRHLCLRHNHRRNLRVNLPASHHHGRRVNLHLNHPFNQLVNQPLNLLFQHRNLRLLLQISSLQLRIRHQVHQLRSHPHSPHASRLVSRLVQRRNRPLYHPGNLL